MTVVKNGICDKLLIASNYIQPCWMPGKLRIMWNVVNWPLIIIAYIWKESCSVTCGSTDKAGSIFCCEFVLLSVVTWLLKFRVCAKQWLPDLAIAVVVIDPTGFLGKAKTEIPHLPLLIGHFVCLCAHIDCGWRRQLQLGTVGLLTFILTIVFIWNWGCEICYKA